VLHGAGEIVLLGGERNVAENADDDSKSEDDEAEGMTGQVTASVEILRRGSNIFEVLPPLSCAPLAGSAALTVDEGESGEGQVLLIGGLSRSYDETLAVHKVDLATGVCTPLPSLLFNGHGLTAARVPDGRIVSVGDNCPITGQACQVLEPPEHGSSSEADWVWRALPCVSVGRFCGGGCVLSDGRFAVFGGADNNNIPMSSCEVLTIDSGAEQWELLPPMLDARHAFACAAIGGCVIVAGGENLTTVEVYEEALGRWRRLPCSLPNATELVFTGSALM
jgi:hypothetical protein